mgnify:CR=1 FL=1
MTFCELLIEVLYLRKEKWGHHGHGSKYFTLYHRGKKTEIKHLTEIPEPGQSTSLNA